KSPLSFFTCNMSPGRTSRAGLEGRPLDAILPSSQARAASERVLKNRAAQSHLSILILEMTPFSCQGRRCYGCKFVAVALQRCLQTHPPHGVPHSRESRFQFANADDAQEQYAHILGSYP